MKILFVYGELIVESCKGSYYHNFLNEIIDRYKPFGRLTICVSKRDVTQPSQSLVKDNNVDYCFIEKENTFYKRFINRTQNGNKLRRLVADTDFLIAHVPSSVSELAVLYAKKLGKKYMTVAVGCPWDALWNHSLKGKLVAPLAYLSMRRVMKNSPYAIYVTNRFLQERYPCDGKSISCSDVMFPTLDDKVLSDRLNRIENLTESTGLSLVTVAAVNVRFKGQQYVIRAIAELKKAGRIFHYYMIGGGDTTYLQSLSEKLDVSSQVHFCGSLSHEEVFSKLEDMDIYIQPSFQEGLPRALVEAMSMALPSLGSRIGGIPELLDASCLFARGNVNEIVEKLLWLDNMKMKELAVRNFKKAKKYSKNVLDDRRWSFINDAINS